jgi:putative hydrolase of the HAD superfamily
VNEATLFADADNTLWDTDAVFARAHLQLLEQVERSIGCRTETPDRLSFVRQIDQHLAELHHSGLRYPPRLLVIGIAQVLRGELVETTVKRVVRGTANLDETRLCAADKEQQFLAAIRSMPALRPGVVAGLEMLVDHNCPVIVVTEGARDHIVGRVQDLGLDRLITRIIAAPKRPELYKRVKKLTGLPHKAFMIGDQLDRDVTPAKLAGLTTIYFPGGFSPKWSPSLADAQPDYVVDDFEDAADLIIFGDRATSDRNRALPDLCGRKA